MLRSDWMVLGTAGKTVDGRVIKEEWLVQMAEQYDPDVYTAVINGEHEQWYGNLGDVLEVRLGKDKHGKTTLEGVVRPNSRLIGMNRSGQKVFWSMEIDEEFADTGKAYLTGLAATDKPASLGTTKAKFSKNKGPLSEPIEFNLGIDDGNTPQQQASNTPGEITLCESEKGVLKKFFSNLFGQGEPPVAEEEENMTEEQLQKLQESIGTAITSGFSALNESLDKKFTEQGRGQQPNEDGGQEEGGDDTSDFSAQFKELETKLSKQVDDAMNGLSEKIEKLGQQEAGGTNFGQGGGDGNTEKKMDWQLAVRLAENLRIKL